MGVNLFSQALRTSLIMWFSFAIAFSAIFLSEQFFLRSSFSTRNRETGEYYNSSSYLNVTNLGEAVSSSNVTKDAIIGIFDAVSGLTHGIGDVLEEIEHGLDDNESVIEKKQEEEEEADKEAETVVLGLFDTLVDFTKQVGKLVNIVGDRLDDRRDDVVQIATCVDDQVNNLGENIIDWKMKHLGLMKDESDSESEEIKDEEDLIVDVDDKVDEEEETTEENLLDV